MSETSSTDLPLTNLRPIILTTGPFLFAWSLIRQYTTKSGPLPFASSLSTIHNQTYALFCLLLSYLLLQSFLLPQPRILQQLKIPLPLNLTIPILNKSSLTLDEVAYLFHLSKFYEYLNVLLLVSQGQLVNQHLAFLHVSMPFLTHFRILNCTGDDWRVFALANTVHLTFKHAYLGGVEVLKYPAMVTGWIQLVGGIGVDALWMYKTKAGKELGVVGGKKGEDEATNRGIAILLLARYAMLYYEEVNAVTREPLGKDTKDEKVGEESKQQQQGKKGKEEEKTKKKR